MNRRTRRALTTGLVCTALLLAACDSGGHKDAKTPGDTTCDGRLDGTSQITVWYHEAPAARESVGERNVLTRQVKAFNAAQRDVEVNLVTLPPGDYDDQVRAAADDGELPDLLDFDAPNLFSYAWAGALRPIDSCLPDRIRSDLLPSILEQGHYAGTLWGVGTFDSGLGLYVRPSVLDKAGIRIPHGPEDAWTAAELTGILARLREEGYRRPLQLHMRYADSEWGTYGFAPAVWSAGGDLIDRGTYRTADGVLNGPGSVRALTTLQNWAKAGYVDPDTGADAFAEGRCPLAWTGHWRYSDYSKAFPGDLRIVPLPDFGHGVATGMGSWQWGVPAGAADGDAVWRFLAFLLSPNEVLRMTETNGAIPATRAAIARTGKFAEGGPERLYIEQLQSGIARPRPQTPAYPAITRAFAHAFVQIMKGAAVKPALDEAVRAIDKDLRDHQYYPPTGR